jgi:hypothetical protein
VATPVSWCGLVTACVARRATGPLLDARVAQMTKHGDDLEAMAVVDPAFARLVDRGVSGSAVSTPSGSSTPKGCSARRFVRVLERPTDDAGGGATQRQRDSTLGRRQLG